MNYFQTGGDLYQWDIGRKVTLALPEGETASVVEFTINNEANALVVDVKGNEAEIPNILLQTAGGLRMWAVTVTADGRQTRRYGSAPVYSRAKPDDYIYTETEVKRYEDFEDRLNALEENGGGAVESVNGQTGAVKLTAADVGAIPVDKPGTIKSTGVLIAGDGQPHYARMEGGDGRAMFSMRDKDGNILNRVSLRETETTLGQPLAINSGGHGGKTAAEGRENLSLYSKGEIDAKIEGIEDDVERLTEEKMDKQQGVDNAGKLLYVGADGNGEVATVALGKRFKYAQERGKNIFPENWENAGINDNGEWVYSNSGTSNIAVNAKIPVTPGGTYTLSNTLVTPSTIVYLHKWDAGGSYLGSDQISRFNTYTQKTVTLTSDVYYITLSAYASGKPDYETVIPDQVMIEAGSTATAYEPYGVQNTLDIRDDAEIPDYWASHISEKIEAIQTLHKTFGKDCFSFVALSDMHYNANLGKKSPLLAKRIMDECAIKYAYSLGDISNQGAATTKDMVIKECEDIEKMIAPIRDRLLMVQGNHDGAWGQLDQDGNGTIDGTEYYCYNLTPGEMHQWLFRKVGLVGDVHFDESGTAYYVDDTASRVRYITLNCNCLDYALNDDGSAKYNTMRMYRFTQKQYDFLLDALVDGLDERWNIVVGAHVPLDGTEGPAWGTASVREYTLMKDFLTAFKNKTSFNGSFAGTSGFDAVTVTADFTTAKANFVGYFCGHMHNDYHLTAETYGIDMIGIASDRSREGMTAGTTTEQSFDVVTVDTVNKKIYCTKIGFGDDREISYA